MNTLKKLIYKNQTKLENKNPKKKQKIKNSLFMVTNGFIMKDC